MIELRINWYCKAKLRLITKVLKNNIHIPSQETLCRYTSMWKKLDRNPVKQYVSVYSSISNVVSHKYVPENVYYRVIEPVLNDKEFSLAYSDKNFYERILGEYAHLLPTVYLRGVAGSVFTTDYNPVRNALDELRNISTNTSLILKPAVGSAGGCKIASVLYAERNKIYYNKCRIDVETLIDIMKLKYNNSFVLQEHILQHEWFSKYNETSLNTVRVMTYRSPRTEKASVLKSVLRYGREGSIVDNQAAGGLSCGINDDGITNAYSIDKYGVKTPNQNECNVVPMYNNIKYYAVNIAPKFHYHRLLGFDFCVDRDHNVRLLEVNTKDIEVNFLQMNNGPLFGDLTEEVIEYCFNNKAMRKKYSLCSR